MPHAEVNGQQLFHTDSGGDGPAVLFSHGFLMDHRMFAPQVEELAPDFRCITWDARGFGETTYDGKPFTYWDSADDAVGLLDHLDVAQAVFVGMSQGGYLSIRAALAHPDRVRALVLIDTFPGVDTPEVIQGYRDMLRSFAEGSDEERRAVAEIVASLILGDESLYDDWIPGWLEREPSDILVPGATLLDRDDLSDRVTEITQPALVVHGTEDAAIPIELGHEMAQQLPDCRGVVEVEGAAHAPNLSHPQVVNPPLREFLDSLEV